MTFGSRLTVSPQRSSDSRGGIEEDRTCGIVRSETNQHVRMDGKKGCFPIEEETSEAISMKVLPSPSPPSRPETLEHNLTHWPFRNWCKHCVAGKAKASQHRHSGATAASEVPVVSMDYAFMGDKSIEESEEEHVVGDDDYEANNADETKAKILVARDSRPRVCEAIPVPRKGLDNDDWSLNECLKFLEFLGYTNVVLKSDQEKALSALMRKIRTHRSDQTQTMQENSPVGDSKSNGFVERTIQTVQGQIRTLRSALEARIGTKIKPTSPVFAWMVIHASTIITLCEVSKDGRVPYQRLRGRRMQPELVEFGESVFCQPLKHLDMGKAEARWMPGVFLGIKLGSGEKVVATEDGIIKVRSIKRRLESERWNEHEQQWINRFPWKPYSDSETDDVHIRPPLPVTPQGKAEVVVQKERDGNPIPRTFKILRKT